MIILYSLALVQFGKFSLASPQLIGEAELSIIAVFCFVSQGVSLRWAWSCLEALGRPSSLRDGSGLSPPSLWISFPGKGKIIVSLLSNSVGIAVSFGRAISGVVGIATPENSLLKY